MKLNGKTIAITGGAGGIGSRVATLAEQKGAIPIIIDRAEPAAAMKWEYIQGDLSTAEGIARIATQLVNCKPDILVNLAGIQHFGAIETQKPEHIALMYQINLIAPVQLVQALLPMMRKRGSGQIVNIGSIFGSIPFAYFATYSSAKAGLKAFSEALRREVAGSGITVTHIAPRAVKTPLNTEHILALAERTNMAMDEPDKVAARMVAAIEGDRKDVYIGFPESLFVRVNALLPRVVDNALAKNNKIAKEILNA